MKKTSTIFAASVVALLLSAPLAAHAEAMSQGIFGQGGASKMGWYAGINTGYAVSQDLGADFNKHDAGSSYIVGGEVGYQFTPNLRTDLGIGYDGSFYSKSTSVTPTGSVDSGGNPISTVVTQKTSISSLPVMANAYLDAGNFSSLVPYIMAGLGFSVNQTDKTKTVGFSQSVLATAPANNLTGSLDGATRVSFAWQVGAGASYDIGQKLKLDVGYRYVDLGQVKTGGVEHFVDGSVQTGLGLKTDLTAHEILVGLRMPLGN